MIRTQRVLYLAGLLFLLGFVSSVSAHGDVTPQALNTQGLENLGDEWLEENPYEGNSVAIEIGASGYNQNCARCHGLQVISGGIAPDLRYLPLGLEGDEWYMMRVRNGYSQNGAYKMPPFENILSQEAMWAIRSFIVSKHEEE
ncbi:MAG: cytochrome c-550 PedF [Deltaproteobacteria bacterium]